MAHVHVAAHLRGLPVVPEDGKRHELIDGVHYVTPSPNLSHQELVGRGCIWRSAASSPRGAT